MSQVLPFCKVKRRTVVLIFCYLLPFMLSPLLFSSNKEYHCGYVILLMAFYWLLEPVSIIVTGFLPIVLFPMLGIMSSSEVSKYYMSEAFVLFLGGLIAAIAVEHCFLHERIALKALLLIGTEIHRLLSGIMLVTMFLSMWMSNTSTTAMMLPIVESLTEEMFIDSHEDEEIKVIEVSDSCGARNGKSDVENFVLEEECPSKRTRESKTALNTTFFLGVCYAANIGGTGTLTGTATNFVLVYTLENYFPECDQMSFSTWTMYNVPAMLICTLIGWACLYLLCIKYSKKIDLRTPSDSVHKNMLKKYEKLGPVKFNELAVLVLFMTLVLLWIFRDPKIINGWATAFSVYVQPSGCDDVRQLPIVRWWRIFVTNSSFNLIPQVFNVVKIWVSKIGDSLPVIAICFLFFTIPANPRKFATSPPLLDWRTAERKIQWGVLILVGGGYSIAGAAKKTGLSTSIGAKLIPLSKLHHVAMVAVICLFTSFLTEVMTNSTTASMLLPILAELAVSTGINPMLLMLPCAVSCLFAFMLPVSTVSNAIVFERGHMKTSDMAKPGVIMNLLCCCVQLLMINTLGVAMFNLNEFPSWAKISTDSLGSSDNFTAITDSFLSSENGTLNPVTELL